MASNSDEGSRSNDDSSEDESLATLKRKADDNDELNNADDNDKRKRMDEESDEGPHPGIFVKVEVEEVRYDDDEAASPNIEAPDPEPVKRRTRPSREKKDPDYVSEWRPPKRKKHTSCPDCGKVFENATMMKEHSIEHQVQTRHKCEVCGRCFSKAFGLKTHKRMHGEKSEHCPICGASFTLAINLNGSRPDERQKKVLVKFLESNPDLVKGTDHGPSKFEAKKWMDAAVKVNASGVAKKDHKGWAKYWTEKKSFLKRAFTRGETSKLLGLDARLFALVRDEFTQNPTQSEPDPSDSGNSDAEDKTVITVEHDDEDTNAVSSPKKTKKESNQSSKVFSPTVNIKASEVQLEKLYQFMERNPGIANGLLRTAQGRIETNRKWASVAKILNALDGAKKDSRGWAKFWTERKCFLKRLHARRKSSKISALDARMSSLLFDNADTSEVQNLSTQETSQDEMLNPECVKEETAADDMPNDDGFYELTSLPPKAFTRPSPLQMLRLVEFLECHPDIANCRTLSIQARLDTKAKWALVAEEFNALGSVKKDGAGWSKFWSEKKFYLRKICAQHQTSRLSALEKRLVAIFDENNATSSPQNTHPQQKKEEFDDSRDIVESFDRQEGLVSDAQDPKDSSETHNRQSCKDNAVTDTHHTESRSPRPRKAAAKPNPSQMLRIVEFLESHPDIANSRTMTMQGRLDTKAKWARVAAEFNELGTVKKDGPGWSKYWSEKKFYLKKICAQHQTLRLSDLEKRLVALIEESTSKAQQNVHAQSDFTATDEFERSVDASSPEESFTASNSAEVSQRQMYALAEFLEHNPQLVRRTRMDDADSKWDLFAQELNQIGDAIKDGRGWFEYWTEKKRCLKKICAKNHISRLSNPELHLATLAGFTRHGDTEDKSNANVEECSNLSGRSSSKVSVAEEENAPASDSETNFKAILEDLDAESSGDDTAFVKSQDSEDNTPIHLDTPPKNVSESQSDPDVAMKTSQLMKDRRSGRPSFVQMEILVEFLEKNPGVALCLFKSPAGRRHVNRKWSQIAAQLASLPGAGKDKNGWIKYWTEKKCYLKRVALNHETARLSDLEKRLLTLVSDPITGRTQRELPQTEHDLQSPEPETIDLRKIDVEQRSIVSNSHRPGHKQMAALVDFLEKNPEIATTCARSSGERRHAAAKWASVTSVLNGLGGAKKDRIGWNKYWVEKKCYLKKVCAQNQTPRLSDPELRLAAILGCLPESTETPDATRNEDSNDSPWEDSEQTQKARELVNTPVEVSEESVDEEELNDDQAATSSNGLRPSAEQLEALLKFLEKNPRIASGRIRTNLGRALVARKWAELTRRINELGAAEKGWRAWVKYWVERKFYLKKLCAKKRTSQLTNVEVRMAKLIGCLPKSLQDREKDWNITSNEVKATRTRSDEVKTDEEELEDTLDAEKAPEKQSVVVSNGIRPGNRQVAALAEFLEQNPRLAKSSRTPTKRRLTAAKWDEVTIILNELGPAQRDRLGWTKYWVEKKCHLKKVCNQNHTSKLSDTDLRLVAILGGVQKTTEDPADSAIVAPKLTPNSGRDEEDAELQNEEYNTLVEASEEVKVEKIADEESAIMSNKERPSKRQMNALLQFLEQNPRSILMSRLARSVGAKKWAEITSKVNKLGTVQKSPNEWMKYCARKKSSLKKICTRRGRSRLTSTQLRMATIFGCLPAAISDEDSEEASSNEEYDSEAKLDAEERSEGFSEPNSLLQMATLVEFLEQNPHIAIGCARTKEERIVDVAKWERVTAKLNQLGNVRKDRKGWKRCWTQRKKYLNRIIARDRKSSLSATDLRLIELMKWESHENTSNTLSDKEREHYRSCSFEVDSRQTSKEDFETVLVKQEQRPEVESETASKSTTDKGLNGSRPGRQQIEALLNFLLTNKAVANLSSERDVGMERQWAGITARLNMLPGVRKNVWGWIEYWTEQKFHLKTLCSQNHTSRLSAKELRLAASLDYLTPTSPVSKQPGNEVDEEKPTENEGHRMIEDPLRSEDPLLSVRRSVHFEDHIHSKGRSVPFKDPLHSEGRSVPFKDPLEPEEQTAKVTDEERPRRRQVERLIEILKRYPGMAIDRKPTWAKLAKQLNSVGGALKDKNGWYKWWISQNAHLRHAIEYNTESQLSKIDKRLVAVLENRDSRKRSQAVPEFLKRARPSLQQMEALIEFLIKNPGVATFAFQGEIGERHLKRKWDEISSQLNALPGVQDDDQGWIKRWTDWNSHLKKVCEEKQAWTLSDLELRLVSALGYPTDRPRGSVDGTAAVVNKNNEFEDYKTRCMLQAATTVRERRGKIVVLKEERFLRPELVLEDPLRLSGFDGHTENDVPCTEFNTF